MREPSGLERLARHQAGVFTRAEALALGWSPSRLRYEAGTGRIRLQLPKTYAFTAAPSSRLQRAVAALKWAGEGAALCKTTAAEFHELDVDPAAAIQVMTSRRLRPPHAQIRVYRRPDLPPHHVVHRRPLVLTSIARTIFDLAWDLGPQRLDGVIDGAQSQRKTTLQDLWGMWGELHASGCNGCAVLRICLERRTPGEKPPSNLNERRLFDLVESRGIPRPLCQVPVHEGDEFLARPDFVYLDRRLALQAQSARWHVGAGRQIADDWQMNRLIAAGWRVLRFWWDDVSRRPEEVAELIARTYHAAGDDFLDAEGQ